MNNALMIELGSRAMSDLIGENDKRLREPTLIRRLEQAGPIGMVGCYAVLKDGQEPKDTMFLIESWDTSPDPKNRGWFRCEELDDSLTSNGTYWFINPAFLEVLR